MYTEVGDRLRARFDSGAPAHQTGDQVDWWPFGAIKGGLRRAGSVREVKNKIEGDPDRLLLAADRETGLKYMAILTPMDGRRSRIVGMFYGAGFDPPAGAAFTETDRANLDAKLKICAVFLGEARDIFIVAHPLVTGKFDKDFFATQLEFFLDELRLTGRFLYGPSRV